MIIRQFCVRHGRSALQNHRSPKAECLRYMTTKLDASPLPTNVAEPQRMSLPSDPNKKVWSDTNAFFREKKAIKKADSMGSSKDNLVYNPLHLDNNPIPVEDISLPLLLASQTHLGHATALWNPHNSSYIAGVRQGIHIISLDVTAAYLRRACKVVQEVATRGGLILFVGTRDGQESLVVRAAKLAGGYHIFDRWVPGSLTNGQQILGHCRLQFVDGQDKEVKSLRPFLRDQPVSRPDLVVCLNPVENEVCLHECGLYNVPTIGIIDTDADPSRVTYPIPANDDSMRSVTLLAGALGLAGQAGQKERLKLAAEGVLTYPKLDLEKAMKFSGVVETEESTETPESKAAAT